MDTIVTGNLRRKARVIDAPSLPIVRRWLALGVRDFKEHLGLSLAYGFGLVILGWMSLAVLTLSGLGWLILPAAAGAMLLGPLATVGLYRISRRGQGLGGGGIAAPGQIFLVSAVMMVLALAWVRAATLLFAIFFGLRPFAGFLATLQNLFGSPEGIALVLVGAATGGLFAALGFAISAFSFPMLVHREIDGFSAMGLSFNASTQNFWLIVTWAICITVLVTLGLLTGLLLLIPIFPILGFATWHAYADLFES